MAVKRRRKTKTVPVSVEVRMYNVGLGDSLLLTFHSRSGSKSEVHRILIDCGSTGRNAGDGPNLKQVATEIVKDCGGRNTRIDAIVVTHRHQDHMSGFGGVSGEILVDNLRPQSIIQPWTENPYTDNPQMEASDRDKAAADYVLSLRDAQQLTDSILKEILVRRENGMDRKTDEAAIFYCQKNLPFAEALTFKKAMESDDELLGGLNVETLKNVDAIRNLQNWSWKSGNHTQKPTHRYIQKDDSLTLGIPGLSVKVLGPVGPNHWEQLDRKGSHLKDELWRKLQALRRTNQNNTPQAKEKYVSFEEDRGAYGVPSIFPDAPQFSDGEFEKDNVRWLREKLDLLRGDQLLQFVTTLDRHINNTSVVLLFEFGGFRMLFPGDAEVASWQEIVKDEKAAAALKKVDLYKVGHHGSGNATPVKSLWEKLIADRNKDHPLHCVLSTQTTKFPNSIPNKNLLATMLDFDQFHLVSTAYPVGESSVHADDWKVNEKGTGHNRRVMSYSRVFEV